MKVTLASRYSVGRVEVHAEDCSRIPNAWDASLSTSTPEIIMANFKKYKDEPAYKIHNCCKKEFTKDYLAGRR